MNFLNNIKIKNKIIVVIFVTGALAAILGGVIKYFYDVYKAKNELIENTQLQAKLLSEYCVLPLEFNYPENATDALSKLQNLPNIYQGILYNSNKIRFASYQKKGIKVQLAPNALLNANYIIVDDFLWVNQSVIYENQKYGNLYLCSYINWKAIIIDQLISSLFVIGLMLIIIIIMALLLHPSISAPIIELTQKMLYIANNKDYNIGIASTRNDEIGTLYNGFNNMLAEIKERESNFLAEKLRAETYLNIVEVILVALNSRGEITLLNRKGYQILGYEPDSLIGKNWFKTCLPVESYDEVYSAYMKILNGELELVKKYENYIITNNGEKRLIEWHNNIIVDNNGKIIGSLSTGEDITERYIAEQKLRESEQMFSDMSTNVPGVIYQFYARDNGQTGFYYISPKATEIFGYSTNPDAVEWKFGEMLHEDDKNNFFNVIAKAIADLSDFVYEGRLITSKGLRWFQCLSRPEKRINEVVFNGIMLDTTERKLVEILLQEKNNLIETQNEEYMQLNEELLQINNELQISKEKAEESDRLKTAFLQNMSHEIRTPMNAIMGFSELLIEQYNNKPKLEKYSKIITQRCSDLLDIINDLLDIAKIESGQLPINYEECSLSQLFDELNTFFNEQKHKLNKTNIDFKLIAHCVPKDLYFITDKVKLRQIFINLIGNAFKFTEAGKIEGGCIIDNNSKYLKFYVSDTGIGIPLDKQEFVFERFSQIQQKSIKNIGGTGLGLSIVKGLVNLLGGVIYLNSEPDKGSTFTFTLPLEISGNNNLSTTTKKVDTNKKLTQKTVLIVEDDYFNAEFLKEILSMLDLNILHTQFGQKALDIVKTQNVDLVLMDIRLPDINGYEITKQIRSFNTSVKIIAQTAYASHDERENALKTGCNEYISKPTNKVLLFELINKLLD